MKLWLKILLVVLVVIFAALIWAVVGEKSPEVNNQVSPDSVDMPQDVARLSVYEGGFQPQSLTISSSDVLEVRSTDGQEHGFLIDELNIAVRLRPLEVKTITFADAAPGTYTFYDDRFAVDGRPVEGTITVQ